MAVDLEKLVAQLSADLKGYENGMKRAVGIMNRTARDIEGTWQKTNRRLDIIGQAMGSSILTPLAGIGAALGVREVLQYADAWTTAKNSLAVAGVVGDEQVAVLDRLFQSAQDNATPIGALADLFGKAAQASDNLGASQDDLLKFSDGVAVSLRVAGTSAGQASGALTQLGQLLGSARVQAEEFNSVNEGARPILIAVANGLDEAGGSVNKLKQLVNDGKVSGQQFFQAFLKGLPSVQKMAADATQTIDQGLTKVNNALTKYIGETDSSLGASQRLVGGLNTLADNFDTTADVVLKVAAVIAGALVGRSIAGMITSLGFATTVVLRFVTALRAAATVGGLATAIGGLSAAAGPLGLIIGGTVVGALALFSQSSERASSGATTYAAALKKVEEAANDVAPAIDGASQSIGNKLANQLAAGVDQGVEKIGEAKTAAVQLFSEIIDNAPRRLITEEQIESISDLRDGLKDGTISAKDVSERLYALANDNPNFQRLADQLAPLLEQLGNAISATKILKEQLAGVAAPSFREAENASMVSYDRMAAAGQQFLADATARANLTKQELALEKEIAEVRKEAAAAGVTLSDKQVNDLAGTRVARDAARSTEGKAPKLQRATADSRFDQDVQAVRDRIAALAEEQTMLGQGMAAQESRRVAIQLEQQALADLREEARRKGEADLASIQLAPEQIAAIREVADAYGQQSEALYRAQESFGNLNDTGRDAVGGIASDLRAGASEAEILANALERVVDRLQDVALDALFGGASSGGGIFSALGGLLGFDAGGYTGDGGKHRPAGVVHKGEYVFDQASVKAAGGPRALDAMRRGLKGYASGGFVGPRIPTSIPNNVASAARSNPGAVNGRIDIGVSVDDQGSLQAYVKKQTDTAAREAAAAGAAIALSQVPGLAVRAVTDHNRRKG
ncbi:tape measure protein [Ancylobacter radicis]|uniref:Phage tail tape measure protein n=1 Tax=Ancylobacter radicis TaxID=2836179 RepID=A0ABS5R3K3_9HYPH|nr:tape measure protein [Ancylobacter radicis]MBS9476243.1 phage tail tape measure protein [Ancylobacter radicis]